jgi:hypothetical protein
VICSARAISSRFTGRWPLAYELAKHDSIKIAAMESLEILLRIVICFNQSMPSSKETRELEFAGSLS